MYLSNEGGVVAVLEVLRKDSSGEGFLVEDNESYAGWGPTY
jgi:hypothetical protein